MTLQSGMSCGTGDPGPHGRIFDRIVSHGGRRFLATDTMAAIFAARAEDVIARQDTELVPLLHRDGVELLVIGPNTAFSVVNTAVELGSLPPRA